MACALSACVSSADPFSANRKQAVRDSRAPEARAYEGEFLTAIGPNLRGALERCTAEFPADSSTSFEMVFRIDHWGEPKAILVNPVTYLSTCVASAAFYFPFPRPDEKFGQQGVALLVPIRIN